MQEVGTSRESAVYIWQDRALFLGDRSVTDVHGHHALEISVALDDLGVHVVCPGEAEVRGGAAVMVRPDAPHRLHIPGPKVAVLYVEPHSPLGRGLRERMGEAPLLEVPGTTARGAFLRLFDGRTGRAEAEVAIAALLASVAPDPHYPWLDWRVRRAQEALAERLADPPSQAALAKELGLSASRLGHLFSAQVGVPMRRYVLWLRLRAALTEALATGSMTDAALAAGFSDAAHFSRTCRRMFGLAPTAFAPVDDVFVATA